MTWWIVIAFFVGYLCIALESLTRVDKAAVALLMAVSCWVLCFVGGVTTTGNISLEFTEQLGETCEIIFFLMGAMTIVECVDTYGGFNFVRERMLTRSKRSMLWRISLITFFLSSVLDNLTTAIVMIMVLRKLVTERQERVLLSCMVIMAANSGGAFSPIGDVTTIMLWVKGNVSTLGVMEGLFLPALVSVLVPTLLLQRFFKGELQVDGAGEAHTAVPRNLSKHVRHSVFYIGVGGLLSVPVFRMLTGLPPFMGILLVLAALWVYTELMFRKKEDECGCKPLMKMRVQELLHKIDLSTILFFLGILMAVSALAQTGFLRTMGEGLNAVSDGNPYLVTGMIGLFSAVIDNVPLVAACMSMYDVVALPDAITPETLHYVVDGAFWELLAYSAGVGGSMLIIGSAAGVAVMSLENITFGWYLRNFSLYALLGYLAGMAVYALQVFLTT